MTLIVFLSNIVGLNMLAISDCFYVCFEFWKSNVRSKNLYKFLHKIYRRFYRKSSLSCPHNSYYLFICCNRFVCDVSFLVSQFSK